jgi:cell division protein FtsN
MNQDFAKIRPEPLLDRKIVQTPPKWHLMLTGMSVGLSLGIFGCALFYLSGMVPPLASQTTSISANSSNIRPAAKASPEITVEPKLELEFFTALADWEVPVNAIPVKISEESVESVVEDTLSSTYLLQTGAFIQRELADSEANRLQALGITAQVKRQDLPGRILFLVQSGPYQNSSALSEAEALLRDNRVPSLRLSVQ